MSLTSLTPYALPRFLGASYSRRRGNRRIRRQKPVLRASVALLWPGHGRATRSRLATDPGTAEPSNRFIGATLLEGPPAACASAERLRQRFGDTRPLVRTLSRTSTRLRLRLPSRSPVRDHPRRTPPGASPHRTGPDLVRAGAICSGESRSSRRAQALCGAARASVGRTIGAVTGGVVEEPREGDVRRAPRMPRRRSAPTPRAAGARSVRAFLDALGRPPAGGQLFASARRRGGPPPSGLPRNQPDPRHAGRREAPRARSSRAARL